MATAPLARFLRFYVLKLGFLDGAAGFAHIAIGAFASFLKHAKLCALERAERRADAQGRPDTEPAPKREARSADR